MLCADKISSTMIVILTYTSVLLLFINTAHCGPYAWHVNTTANPVILCPDFDAVENGIVHQIADFYQVKCNEGYDLEGNDPIVYCNGNKWQPPKPRCNKRCYPPPHLINGTYQIEGVKDSKGRYSKGTVATYTCNEGFKLRPKESEYRVCVKGIWSGAYATCQPIKQITSCPEPKELLNGYYVHEKTGDFEGSSVGQRLHYSCKSGYVLIGTPVQQCLEEGSWSPKIPPSCSLQFEEDACTPSPGVPHSNTTVLRGYQSDNLALPGTIVEIHCHSRYRNARVPCSTQPGKLQCIGGRWQGVTPVCVPVRDCEPPPAVSYAVIYNLNPATYESTIANRYPIKSQISYQCLPGYALQGQEVFSCSSGGCWLPLDPPTCYPTTSHSNYFLEVNNINAVLITAATGAGVLGVLLVICVITVCKRRKPLSRAVPIAAPVQRADLGDHASLLHHPDRLALIAFADGMQNDQTALPTYDEATRAPSLLSTSRLHRPHWPNLGGRRSRNGPNPDHVITRHGSFASHTPSTRSAGDSMGSTDTVAISEGSTTVTLDTASSHSGSQPASCRVHCGSLASFDTSSVINTEGVPLLEESELEEIQGGDNLSLVVDNPSMSDSLSFKLSTNSADLS